VITTPQTVPTDQIPIAIGSSKLRDAANKGDAGAAYEVAVRFAEGRGVPANVSESARWFERAAKAGLAQAQFRLGSLYEKGQGVKKDLEKARQNYVAAAAQGNGKAMHNLAVLYAEGLAGKPDFATAIQWFQKASARGIADSQYNLAVLYARGLGGEKNLGESYKWFALAAAQGDKEAGRKRDEVASQLDAKDLAAAKHAVKTWTAVTQPAAATTVPEPAGGWDEATPVTQDTPKVRASTGMVKVGRR
jgi:localization factor PodJL